MIRAALALLLPLSSSLSVQNRISFRTTSKFGLSSRPHVTARQLRSRVTEKLELPPQKVIDAVEKEEGRKLTVSDLSAKTGIPLADSQKALMNLAGATGATMQVSEEGDLCYVFPNGVRGILISRSLKQRLIQTFGKTLPVAMYLTRIAFGVMLFASVTALTLTIASLSAATQSSDDDDDGREMRLTNDGFVPMFSPGPTFFFHFGPSPWDFLRWDYYHMREQRYQMEMMEAEGNKKLQRQIKEEYEQERGMGILQAVFSYVFGDAHIQEVDKERVMMAAEYIRRAGGTVVAEQLYPYLFDPGELDEVDHTALVPILQALGGVPEVTENGNIVYVFPELSRTGGWSRQYESPDAYFEELTYKFSKANTGEKVAAGALCAANLVLAVVAVNMIETAKQSHRTLPTLAASIANMEPLLLLYAVGLNAIPIGRAVYLAGKNRRVTNRNARRKWWAKQLRTDPEIKERVKEASNIASGVQTLDQKKMVFSTDEEVDSTLLAKDAEFGDFDKKLAVGKADSQ